MKRAFLWPLGGALLGVGLAGAGLAKAQSTDADGRRTSPFALGIGADLGGYRSFPADNPWNTPVDRLPLHSNSAAYIASIGAAKRIHPDFGANWNGGPFGIPYIVADEKAPLVPVTFQYDDESDPGPYPVPHDTPIEGGEASEGDRHMIIVQPGLNRLHELYAARPMRQNGKIVSVAAGSGARFNLNSNQIRPAGWTSADAAGLPIFPGLVRYDEVSRGEIRHALRFTVRKTQRGYIAPATHYASRDRNPDLPPMGLRLRLRGDFDISSYPAQARVVLKALQKYGMILADNGGDWYISGAPDSRWDDEQLNALKRLRGQDFEAVQTGPLVKG